MLVLFNSNDPKIYNKKFRSNFSNKKIVCARVVGISILKEYVFGRLLTKHDYNAYEKRESRCNKHFIETNHDELLYRVVSGDLTHTTD